MNRYKKPRRKRKKKALPRASKLTHPQKHALHYLRQVFDDGAFHIHYPPTNRCRDPECLRWTPAGQARRHPLFAVLVDDGYIPSNYHRRGKGVRLRVPTVKALIKKGYIVRYMGLWRILGDRLPSRLDLLFIEEEA
jgi:hypothetical protein